MRDLIVAAQGIRSSSSERRQVEEMRPLLCSSGSLLDIQQESSGG